MGSHTESQLIVKKALQLHAKYPSRPALTILDEAMKLSNGYVDLEWESTDPNDSDRVHPDYDRETLPPAPFAELLRKAFAPDLDVAELVFSDEHDSSDFVVEQLVVDSINIWTQRVEMPFASRYGIEGENWFPCVTILDKPTDFREPKLGREIWMARFAGELMTWASVSLADARRLAESSFDSNSDKDPEFQAGIALQTYLASA